jgi:hypothetical protein
MEPERTDFRKGDIVGHISNLGALGWNQNGFNLLRIRSSPDLNREPCSRSLHDRDGEVGRSDAAVVRAADRGILASIQLIRVATLAIHIDLAYGTDTPAAAIIDEGLRTVDGDDP